MTDLFLTVLEISVSVSLVIVFLLLVSPFLNRRYAARWKYLIWIFLAVRLLVPVSGADGRSAADMLVQWKGRTMPKAEQSGEDMVPAEAVSRRVVVEIPVQMTTPLEMPVKRNITLLDIGCLIWLAGSLLYIFMHIIIYLHYKKQVMKNGRLVKETAALQQFLKIKRELHIRHTIPLIEFSGAASPMVLGFFRPVLVLPEGEYSEKELYFILKHELVHVKRGDVYWKLLFMTVNGVHWFNPLIWIMQKEAAMDMELSCDERVTQGAGLEMKKAYTETLLSTLHKGCGKSIVLSTGFYGGKQIMKKRFRNILRKTGKKNGVLVLVCAVTLTVCMGTLVGCSAVKEKEGSAPGEESGRLEENLSGDGAFINMAGSWMIDFDRTDPMLWGTGISFGDGMEISGTGEFSYYIGIGVGGTGQCEVRDGAVTVEIEPYEENSAEKEILTLAYENDGSTEYILMNWHEEDVYWVRSVRAEEVSGADASGNEITAEDMITLTIMKEGIPEEKQAQLVVERGVLTGKEYALYLPVGEWQKTEADTWQAAVNGNVRIWVSGFTKDYPVGQTLEDDGYVPEEEGMVKQESGVRYKARLYESEDALWCVEYCYPEEMEEGWEQELSVIADTFAEVTESSRQILGYITEFEEGLVTIDLQDWLTPESEGWKPEYDAEAGFQVVDLEGVDAAYPVRGDCTYTILENHSGPGVEVDREAFERYLRETEFPMLWGAELEDGEVVSLSEWYRP